MTDAERTGGGWRRPLLFVLLGLAVGVAGTAAVIALTGDSGSSRASGPVAAGPTTAPPGGSTATSAPPPDNLGPAAKELVALAGKGREKVFHARYGTKGGLSPTGKAFTVRMELWNRHPEVRRNVSIDTDGQVLESADLRRNGLFIRCGKPSATAPWQCVTPPNAPNDPGGAAFGLAPAALAGRPVEATDEMIADQKARCFRADPGTGTREELCLSAEGIPLRVTSGSAILELESLELSVGDGAFEPPARPIGA